MCLEKPTHTRAFVSSKRTYFLSLPTLCFYSLFLDVKVYCGPGSFGPTCSVTCQPRKDNSAGYKCDRMTGSKICLAGQFVIIYFC